MDFHPIPSESSETGLIRSEWRALIAMMLGSDLD
jgi:hypothetical protein